MKSYFGSVLLTLPVIFLLSSFIALSVNAPIFTVTIEGVETVDLQEGVMPSQLANMTIEADDANVRVEEFEVILARGSRPVVVPDGKVTGNSYDLAEYSTLAKSGDRLVINLIEINGLDTDDIPFENTVIIIPIK